MEKDSENVENEALFIHLWEIYNFTCLDEFKKNYQAIKLGYLLALLET